MRQLFMMALIALTMGTSAFAKGTTNANKTVTASFKADFKGASDVNWTLTKEYAKASFTMGDKKMEAYYSDNGEVMGTSTGITVQELPLNAKRTLAKKYEGYNIKEAIHFVGSEEEAYYISAENEKERVILKVSENDQLSIFKRTKK